MLTDLKVPEEHAREAAEASVPDLSGLATKADLQATLAGFEGRVDARFAVIDARFGASEDRMGRLIAERTDAQTKWIAAIAASTVIILLSGSAYLWPPTRYAAPPPPVSASQH